jgi:hypothetical protein
MSKYEKDLRKAVAERSAAVTRRALLRGGAGALGLFSVMGQSAMASVLGDEKPTYMIGNPTAKRMILVFANGGMSHLDLFEDKPLLNKRFGEEIPPSILVNRGVLDATKTRGSFPVVGSKYSFKSYGESGMRFSELVPKIGAQADRMTVLRSVQVDHVLHEAAISQMLTGAPLDGRPSWGAWMSYALGSMNENIPEFVVLVSNAQSQSPAQPRLWGNGFLPGKYAGTKFRSGKSAVLDITTPEGISADSRRKVLEALEKLNGIESERSGDPDVETRIKSYEMAARMQTSVPKMTDLSTETPEMLELYGVDPTKGSFASNCIQARRLVEGGARFVQLIDGGWDMHNNVPQALPRKARDIDQGIGALMQDLDQRGLLDDTLIVVSSEFGRTPHCQGAFNRESYGRDHHPLASVVMMAGGGVKRGFSYGKSDEWGWDVIENPVHIHDIQATAMHCMGIDHERLRYRYQGRDFRLTDVGGNVVHGILS